jgi:hypothetical protein
VAFFVVLMFVPLFTTMNTFGTHVTGPAPSHQTGAPADEHAGH